MFTCVKQFVRSLSQSRRQQVYQRRRRQLHRFLIESLEPRRQLAFLGIDTTAHTARFEDSVEYRINGHFFQRGFKLDV